MENNNNIASDLQPPFEVSSGGSLDKGASTSYQKKIYNDALLYAQKNKDSNPKDFAEKIASSIQPSHGKNNPFGELATKSQPRTIKNGVKYRDYPTITIPLSSKYNEYLQEQNNQQLEQQQIIEETLPPVDNNFEQTQQPVEESYPPQGQQNQMQLPQQQPQSVYERNYSDQQVQGNNPSDQINVSNPIQHMAMGGYKGKSYEGGGKLNAFNVGNTHEQNPLGGIPQGTGSNGQPNTVEQDETSFDIDGQKFIFSNRIFL